MSKNLRVFLLSVLVVVLGVSSAFAALPTYRIMPTDVGADGATADGYYDVVDADGKFAVNSEGNPIAWYSAGQIVINGNGIFTFDDSFMKAEDDVLNPGQPMSTTYPEGPVINYITLDPLGDALVTDAVFVVPTPYPKDAPSEGTKGLWRIAWPAQIRNNVGVKVDVSNNNRVKFTIQKRSTNSAILVVDSTNTKNNLFEFYDQRDGAGPVREVRNGWDFVLNAPIRTNRDIANAIGIALEVIDDIQDGGKFTFDREAEIFADDMIPNEPTGYSLAAALPSVLTVHPGGELIIRNRWAIRGNNLLVDVWPGVGVNNNGQRATLTFDLDSGPALDLRGIGNNLGSRGLEVDGSTLIVDGNINVLSDMELWGEIQTRGQYQNSRGYLQPADTTTPPVAHGTVDDSDAAAADGYNVKQQTIFKTGPAKLTLSDSSDFEKPTLSNQVRWVNVLAGTLEFASHRTWWAGGWDQFDFPTNNISVVTPTVTVSEGAEFIANTNSIVDDNAGRDPDNNTGNVVNSVAFVVNGTARFFHHAIYKRDTTNAVFNEIYPYETFVTFNNGLLINARDIRLTVGENGRVIVDNGAFAAGTIAGKGTIEIKNDRDPSRDRAVLILTEPFGVGNGGTATYRAAPSVAAMDAPLRDDNYARSYIDFEGTIIGGNLGLYTPFATDIAYSRRIFQYTKSVDLDNLIVYGPAQLNVDANTKLNGIDNIWLRSHRPGAANYNANGTVNTQIAYSKLTVGKLNFTPGERNTDIYINSLKVDGSSSYEDMGEVQVLPYDNDTENSATVNVAEFNAIASTYPRDYSAREAVVARTLRYDADANGAYDDLAAIRLGANRDTKSIGPRLNAHIGKLEFYANSGANRDFPANGYYNPQKGIYALRLNNTAQPSRILINGTEVTGNGLVADFNDEHYQVEVTSQSDVRFTGDNGRTYYPLAENNSLKVKHSAKLMIDRGAIVDGHLAFEPSNIPDDLGVQTEWPAYNRHWILREYRSILTDQLTGLFTWRFLSAYPADEDFIDDEGWYDGVYGVSNGFAFTNRGRQNGPTINDTLHRQLGGFLINYTTFTTQVGKNNRWTNDGGEFAVQVRGDITLASDDLEGYSGRGQVLVRAEPDLSTYEAYEFSTIGQRFKVLGEAEGGGKYTEDFATPYNRFFLFRIPSVGADPKGVTVENRDEVATITLDDWSFMEGGADFGMGDGHNFSIKIPFTITYRGENVTIERTVDADNSIHYYVGLGGERYEVGILPTFFNYEEGMASSNENVSDITALTSLINLGDASDINNTWANSTYVSDDITVRAEFDTVSGDQFVRLIGTSYSGEKPVNVRLALYLVQVISGKIDWLDGVVPGFRDYAFIRQGLSAPDKSNWSTATTSALGNTTDVTMGDGGSVSFAIKGLRKATFNTNTSVPVFENGTYVWKNQAVEGTYYLLDSNGNETRVKDLVLARYDGDYLKKDTGDPKIISDDFTLEVNDNVGTVTVPVAQLGTTNGKLSAIKGLALRGTKVDGTGEIITVPVNFTLHKDVDSAVELGSQTVTIGGESVSFRQDIDDIEGVLHFIPYSLSTQSNGMPSWLGYTEYDGGFGYNTGDLSGVAPGTYNFSVLAYSGEDSVDSTYKLYNFSLIVQGEPEPEEPGIAGEHEVSVNVGDTATIELRLVGGATGTFSVADNSNPADLLTITSAGVITVNAAGVAAGDYNYTITAGEYTHAFKVTVVQPEFGIEEVANGFTDSTPIDGRTYVAIYRVVGAPGAVEWVLTDNTAGKYLHKAVSGDMFIVEGIAKAAKDADDADVDQSFIVQAKSGNYTTDPIEVDAFTVDPEDAEKEFTSADLKITGNPAAVAAGFRVDLPAGTTTDSGRVFLPSWLVPLYQGNPDNDVIIGVAFAGSVGDLPDGTEGTIVIEATNADGDDVFYKLPVTYAAAPVVGQDLMLSVTGNPILSVKLNETDTSVTIAARNVQGTVSYVSDASWVTVNAETGVVTVAPTDASLVSTTPHTVTITATDVGHVNGKNEAEVTLTITVTSAGGGDNPPEVKNFAVSVTGSRTLSVKLNETDTSVTLTPSNVEGTVSYTSSANWVTVNASTGRVTVAPTAESLVSTTPHTVTITATDVGHVNGTGSAEVTLTITVTAASGGGDNPPSDDFALEVRSNYARGVSFDMAAGEVSFDVAAVVNAVNNQGTVSYTVASSNAEGLKAELSGGRVTLTPLKAGSYTVRITGTDSAGNTATASVPVTVTGGGSVSSSGGGCDTGFGALALVFAAPLFLRRRRS